MATHIRNHSWRLTPLGGTESWPQALRTAVEIMLQSHQPAFVCWGSALTTLYNDAAIARLGARHPQALGRPYSVVWADQWPDLKPVVDATLAGEAQHVVSQRTKQASHADPASWHTYSWMPLHDETGRVCGFYCVATETILQLGDEQLRTILENTHDAVNMMDVDSRRLLYINPAAAAISGFSKDELQAMSAEELFARVHPDDSETAHAQIRRLAAAQDEKSTVEYRWKVKSGEYRWFSVSRKLVREPAGQPVALVSISRDITETKQAEAALRDSQTRLELALDSADMGTWEWDIANNTAVWNAKLYELLGLPPQMAADPDAFFKVVYPDDLALVRQSLDKVIESGREWRCEFRVVWPDGSVHWLNGLGKLFRYPDGSPHKMIGVNFDFTERKRAEQEILAGRATLEAALRSMTDAVFIADTEGRLLQFNDAFAAFHRFSGVEECANELKRYGELFEVLLPNGKPATYDEWAVTRALQGEPVVGAEFTLRRKDTGESWIGSFSAGPIRDQEGRITGAVVSARDVTEAKKAQEALRNSEARLAVALESAEMGIWEWDLKSNVVIRSPKVYALLGLDPLHHPDQVDTFLEMIHPEDRENVQIGLQNIQRGGRDWRSEFRIILPDGSIRWLIGVGRLFREEDGTPKTMFGVNYDITEQKQAEADLRSSEARYRLLHESLRDGFVQTTMAGRITHSNTVFCEMLGYSEEELQNLTYLDLTPERWHAAESAIVEYEVLRRGYSEVYEKEYRRKDGSIVPAELRTVLARDEAGNPTAMWAIVRDISERRSNEARTHALKEQLVHVGRVNELSQVSAGIAHELNQPLAAMHNYAGAAKRLIVRGDKASIDAAQQAITKAGEQAARAGEIIRRMRDFVEKRSTNRKRDDVNAIIQEAAALGLIGAKADGIETRFCLAPNLPHVVADRIQIEQVLVNLLHNAMDAMAQSPERILTLSSWAHDGVVEIIVGDTGRGIPDHVKDCLFQPFVTTKPEGMGIGLAISKSIVEAHGGDIIAEANPGGGTRFRLRLPIAADES